MFIDPDLTASMSPCSFAQALGLCCMGQCMHPTKTHFRHPMPHHEACSHALSHARLHAHPPGLPPWPLSPPFGALADSVGPSAAQTGAAGSCKAGDVRGRALEPCVRTHVRTRMGGPSWGRAVRCGTYMQARRLAAYQHVACQMQTTGPGYGDPSLAASVDAGPPSPLTN